RIESTVTMKGKQVTMIASPGARLSSVSRISSCTVRRLNDCPLPKSIETSCADAGTGTTSAATRSASASAAPAAISRRPAVRRPVGRVSDVIREIGDLGQAHPEPARFVADLLQLAARDQPVSDVEFDRVVDGAVEGQH